MPIGELLSAKYSAAAAYHAINGFQLAVPEFPVGAYATLPHGSWTTAPTSTLPTTVGMLRMWPLICPFTFTSDQVSVQVTNASATGGFRLGLYRVSGMDASLVVDFGEIPVTSVGKVTYNLGTPLDLTTGNYFVGISKTAGTTGVSEGAIRGATVGSVRMVTPSSRLAASIAIGSVNLVGSLEATVGTGALPESVTTALTTNSAMVIPSLEFRRSA